MSRFARASTFVLALSAITAAASEPSPFVPKDDHFVDLPIPRHHVKRAPVGNDEHGTRFSLGTNQKWQGAKQVWQLRDGDPSSGHEQLSQDWGHIWESSCIRGQQVVNFTRRYWLPGPPKNVGARFQVSYRHVISDIKVFVNGALAFNPTINHVPEIGAGFLDISKAESELTDLFKYGHNEVRIEATKARGVCKGGFPQKRLGLAVEVYGDFAADLWTEGGDQPDVEIVRHIPAGQTAVALESRGNNFRNLRNLGPSGAYIATLQISVLSTGVMQAGIGPPNGVGEFPEQCEINANLRTLVCEFGPLPPGKREGVEFVVVAKLFDNWQTARVSVGGGWGSVTEDPVGPNNGKTITFILCSPTSTDPKCAR